MKKYRIQKKAKWTCWKEAQEKSGTERDQLKGKQWEWDWKEERKIEGGS